MNPPPNPCHGNPTIMLPPSLQGGRLQLLSATTSRRIWQSHHLAGADTAVHVDTWTGVFEGDAAGWSLLGEGDYLVRWLPDGGPTVELPPIRVEAKQLWAQDLTGQSPQTFDHSDVWRPLGQWRMTDHGLVAQESPSYLFRTGAMHGELAATFEQTEQHVAGRRWGLLARVYNGFHHLRIALCQADDRTWAVELLCIAQDGNRPVVETVLARAQVPCDPRGCLLQWTLNGSRHEVSVNGRAALTVHCDYMGGVDVMGAFAEPGAAALRRLAMKSTQAVRLHTIRREQYVAMVRPGNIAHLSFTESNAPQRNICWESGVQYGHIGGSEMKFSQAASQRITDDGPVATVIRWSGPMPRMVDRNDDIRGWAYGQAAFYPDRIILDDNVLAWVRRTVGPDLDLCSRTLAGPARIALGSERTFRDWLLPLDGRLCAPQGFEPPMRYPVLFAAPLNLGGQRWWLKALIALRRPLEGAQGGLFAWRCVFGLTASHDFRVMKPDPGREFSFSLILGWQRSDETEPVEVDLLNLREDWESPMSVEVTGGKPLQYEPDRENPREAMNFAGCFDRASGRYVVAAESANLSVRLDPGDIVRRPVCLAIRGWPGATPPACRVEGIAGDAAGIVSLQRSHLNEWWVWLNHRIDRPIHLHLHKNG